MISAPRGPNKNRTSVSGLTADWPTNFYKKDGFYFRRCSSCKKTFKSFVLAGLEDFFYISAHKNRFRFEPRCKNCSRTAQQRYRDQFKEDENG